MVPPAIEDAAAENAVAGPTAPASHALAEQVVVMGISGSGKSTIGALLARSLGIPFLDADGLHPEANIVKMASGLALTDADRWPWLALVGQALAEAGAAGGGLVIACSALKQVYRDAILQAAPRVRFVHLAGSASVLATRLEGRSEHFMPPALLQSQLSTLEPLGSDEPGFAVDIDQPVASILTLAVARLQAPELPASVRLEIGTGGLPVLRVTGPGGSAEILLQGAHVTGWQPAGRPPVLWLSAESDFAPGHAVRGGVPVCFPWFGPHETDAAAPLHGFARTADWQVISAQEQGDDVQLTLRLRDTPASRASAWPHRFTATLRVTVGENLTLALQVTNDDATTVSFEEAFHTYLRVPDVCTVEVSGLDDRTFIDRLTGITSVHTDPVSFATATDRVYLGAAAHPEVSDPTGRIAALRTIGAQSTVLWNPGSVKAAQMPDFGAAEWTDMVCVETANVLTDRVTLAPGETRTMTVAISGRA